MVVQETTWTDGTSKLTHVLEPTDVKLEPQSKVTICDLQKPEDFSELQGKLTFQGPDLWVAIWESQVEVGNKNIVFRRFPWFGVC